jgi:large subunit ribosomal protein L22
MATRIRTKAADRKENADKRPHAIAKHVRISPRKASIVLDLIRGKSLDEATAILMNTPRRAAPIIQKVLDSAAANAENNLEMDRGSLYVAECFANQGPTLKRGQPHGRGMFYPILKRTSHITVILDQAQGG